jgi:TPR repeat protein
MIGSVYMMKRTAAILVFGIALFVGSVMRQTLIKVLMLAIGNGDYAEAVKWFRLSAEQGYAKAQYNLALMYANGQGVSQDYKEAVKWYRLSAEQGNADAQIILA